jgi:D-alanyl-D-alanine carboxypeptidase (penicillin-binding protein 5/6)
MIRKSVSLFVIIGCLVVFLINPTSVYAEIASQPSVSAEAAVVMDASSERILFAKNAQKRMKIASVTKIMTAILAIERGDLDKLVTVSPNAVRVEGSSIYLKPGDKVELRTLLYGLMLRSGNDAALAIAEEIGGSVEGFVYLMNEKVEYLGLENTHFNNPHGLDDPEHYSSAEDLARITAYAMKNPTFREIVKTKVITTDWPGETWRNRFFNKNKLLQMYPWADGVKTGYTKKSGRTLVSSATKNGQQLIAVTLNDPNDWLDSIKMFEYGFSEYPAVTFLREGQVIHKSKEKKMPDVVAGETFRYPLTAAEKRNARVRVEPIISYPLKLAQEENLPVGSARIFLNDQLVGVIPLVTKYPSKPSFFSRWKQLMFSWFEQGEES